MSDTLTALAMLGLDRQGETPLPPLPPGCAEPPDHPPAARLLDRLALASVAARQAPPVLPAGVPLAPMPESRWRKAPRLEAILAADFKEELQRSGEEGTTLYDWLETAAAANAALPPALLPAVMALQSQLTPFLLPAVHLALDDAGRWLATQNPDWAALAGDDSAFWTAAKPAQKVAFIKLLRKRSPGRATAFLATVWRKEAADTRADLIDILASNLSDADLPLLREAAQDRSQSVRGNAVKLLCRLGDADTLAGLAPVLGPALHVKGLLSKTVSFEPPAVEALEHIPGKPFAVVWNLRDLLPTLPLDFLSQLTGLSQPALNFTFNLRDEWSLWLNSFYVSTDPLRYDWQLKLARQQPRFFGLAMLDYAARLADDGQKPFDLDLMQEIMASAVAQSHFNHGFGLLLTGRPEAAAIETDLMRSIVAALSAIAPEERSKHITWKNKRLSGHRPDLAPLAPLFRQLAALLPGEAAAIEHWLIHRLTPPAEFQP